MLSEDPFLTALCLTSSRFEPQLKTSCPFLVLSPICAEVPSDFFSFFASQITKTMHILASSLGLK